MMARTPEQQEILDAIAAAAVDLQVLMPDTAEVVRSSTVPDGMGGQITLESVIGTVPCRRSALPLLVADKVSGHADYSITVPVGSDVGPGDALLVEGKRFEVQFVPTNTYAAALKLRCREVS